MTEMPELYLKRLTPLNAKNTKIGMVVRFSDGVEQPAEMFKVGGNQVVMCERGIVVMSGVVFAGGILKGFSKKK